MIRSLAFATCTAVAAWTFAPLDSHAQETRPLRIGVITFLSGPAAGPFGVPAKNAADLLADAFNKGGSVPGYEQRGFGGQPIELVFVDEAGGPTKVVTECRNLVSRQNVDMVIGVISSGDCLAVAPVAEEMKKLTALFDCSTNRGFEEARYRYVFRTTTMATRQNVAAARYVVDTCPEDEIIAAFEHLKFESVAAIVDMSPGKGHQAVQSVPYGTIRMIDGKPTLTNVKYYSPDRISPPDGVKSLDWIRSGFRR